jgi:histidine ammonia-lyase
MNYFEIDGRNLTVENSIEAGRRKVKLRLSRESAEKVKSARKLVDKWIKNNEIVYGITTGFGEFKDVRIGQKDTEKLQINLLLSHSAGVGSQIPSDIVKLMLLFRINSLAKGHSGVRLKLLQHLIKIYNNDIIPVIPSQGSVGSSGDLSPLSHLSLVLIGKGKCYYKGNIIKSDKALRLAGLKPIRLSAKEGLALTNGTQMMSAYLSKSLNESIYLSKVSDVAAGFSLEALKGTDKAYSDKLQKVRPHPGQIVTARNLRKLLRRSEIMKSHIDCDKVQDAYSTRCVPQVHGAVKDTINFVKRVLETEINSATDNPLIFPETGEHIEGGNFHGEPLALAADYLAIAVSELGNISERRTYRLTDGTLSGLPRFLIKNGGINSGLMISQYTAASLASENKVLCHPASVDSIPTSASQEDHNSMGSISARKCYEVINNVKKIIAIEFLCASQALEFLKPLNPGIGIKKGYDIIRKQIKPIENDVIISDKIEKIYKIIFESDILKEIEKAAGKLEY